MTTNPKISANGIALENASETLIELQESSDLLDNGEALQARMASDGYLFFRGLIPAEQVLAARLEILQKFAIIGEVDSINHPVMDAIQSDHSFADQVNLRAFAHSLRTGMAYEQVVLHPRLLTFLESLLGDEVRPYDFRWPRFARPGEGCGFHYDGPYMNRGTERIFSTWIPLGDVARHEGSLILLENSHQQETLLNTYARKDADKDKIAWLGTDPNKLMRRFGGRWMTTDFKAGDVLCFGMHMLHGALDNNSPRQRCRLSSDTRYQSANEPLDERWNGADPEAHGYDKVFFPGLGQWQNREFQDEWKKVDARGRLVIDS